MSTKALGSVYHVYVEQMNQKTLLLPLSHTRLELKFTEKSAEILLEMFSNSPLSSILNAMIPLCEPASAHKTGLEHNVWYLVVQGDVLAGRTLGC